MLTNNVGAELAARLRRMRDQAAGPAIIAAANAAGRGGETTVKMMLQRTTHSAGTPTPAPVGGPPAKVSGTLARSVQRTPAKLAGPGVAVTVYGPTVIYGRVQEEGATITVRNKLVLANVETGQVFGRTVTIPKRPFMKPSAEVYAESGKLAELAGAAFQKALLL